jgi:hypothetical protein
MSSAPELASILDTTLAISLGVAQLTEVNNFWVFGVLKSYYHNTFDIMNLNFVGKIHCLAKHLFCDSNVGQETCH